MIQTVVIRKTAFLFMLVRQHKTAGARGVTDSSLLYQEKVIRRSKKNEMCKYTTVNNYRV